MYSKRACQSTNNISKASFLAMLPSVPDTRYVTVVATGDVVRIDRLNSSPIHKLVLNSSGSGYSSAPTIEFRPKIGGLNGFRFDEEWQKLPRRDANGNIIASELAGLGPLYYLHPDFSHSQRDAEAEAIVVDGAVTEINIVNAGYGYTKAPNIFFIGGGGNGASATAYLKDFYKNIKNGVYKNKYKPIETAYPRKILVDNPNWTINSFNPSTREICISIGSKVLSYTVPSKKESLI